MLTLTSLTMWLRWEQAGSGGMLTLTSLTIWLCWEQAVSGGSGFAGSKLVAVDLASLVAVECSLSPLTIWLRWEQAVSSGSGLPGSCGSGLAGGSGMLALTSDNLASQGASC